MPYRPHPAAQAAAGRYWIAVDVPAAEVDDHLADALGYAADRAETVLQEERGYQATVWHAADDHPADGEQPRPHPTHEQRLAVLDGRDPLAFVIIRPNPTDPEAVDVESQSRGMSPAAVAHVLSVLTDRYDQAARTEDIEEQPTAAELRDLLDKAIRGFNASALANTELRARVTELEKRITRALDQHTKYDDSEHCQHDGEIWPCLTAAALDPEAQR